MPYNAVKTKDGHIVIDAHLPKFWSSFCLALNVKELETDPRFHNLEARNNHRQELLNLLNDHIFHENQPGMARHPGGERHPLCSHQ